MELWLLGQVTWYGLVNGAAYVIFALGVTLIYGVMRVLNLAHGEAAMLGAMFAYALMTYLGVNYFLALPLSVALVAAGGVIVNRVAVQPLLARSAPLAVLISTIGVSYILLHGSGAFWGSHPYALESPLSGVTQLHGGIRISQESVTLLIFAVAGIFALYLLLKKAGLGKDMQATAQDLTGAGLIGINTSRVYDNTLVIASGLAALSGILIATVWSASTFLGQRIFLKGFVIVMLGGMGNLWGVIAIGLSVGILEALFGAYVSPYYREAFVYGIMIVVLLVKPEGIFARR